MSETCPAELPNWCAQRHWSIFWILILCSVAMVTAKVITAGNVLPEEAKPFFCANDRSRWTTVRALGDEGTFEIDTIINSADGRQWDSIDKVQHIGADGEMHAYSSKPPLLAVLVTANYVGLKMLTGWSLEADRVVVVRTLLLIVNVLPWAVYLWFVARMINSVPVRDWTRYYVLGCAGFATFLTPFAVSLNNHLPGAICVMIALYCVSELMRRESVGWIYFSVAGLFAALSATFELPALAFLVLVGLLCGYRSISKMALSFLPAAALVAAAAIGTNWWAHGQLRPAYAQRSDGAVVATVNGDFESKLDAGELPGELRSEFPPTLDFNRPTVERGAWPSTPSNVSRWVVRDEITSSQLAITSSDQQQFEIRDWQNWYDYIGSYWLATNDHKKSTIDLGQPSVALYAFHCLFGHHGIFSLTPIWLFSLAGMLALVGGAKMGGRFQMRWLGILGIVLSVVVVTFYLTRPEIDRNYGGFACSLRWLLWLVPIWLMTMLPVVDWLASFRWGKLVLFAVLFVSSISALYHADNPWTHPWLYQVWDLTGLPK